MHNIHNQLDYNLTSLEERLAYLQNNIQLSELSSEQLELCTNYVLYAADLKYKPEDNLELLEELDYNLAKVENTLIQKKNTPIDWSKPDLSILAATYQSLTLKIEHLKSAEMLPLEKAKLLKFYQKWRSSVVADAHLYPSQESIGYYTTTDKFYDTNNSAAEKVYRIINFSDPYHLRSILLEWHNLHSSPDMEPLLDFFNLIYWSTPMKPWERHLLERWKDKVDGLKNLDIQQDLWLTTGRLINHHNYLNQAVVRLCQRMTDTYYALQAEKHFAGQTAYWKYCPVCGRWKIDLAPFWKKQEYGEGETSTKKQEMCESCRLAEKIEVGKKLTAKNLSQTQLSNLEKRIAEFELMQQWTLYKSGLVESWTAKKRQLSPTNGMPKNKQLKNTFGYTIEQTTDAAEQVTNFYLLSLMNQLETEGKATIKSEYKKLNGKLQTSTTETIANLMGRYVANNYNFSSSFDTATEIEEEYIPLLKFLTRHYAEKMGDHLMLKYKTMPFFGIPEVKIKAKGGVKIEEGKDILRADDFIAEHIEKIETSIGYKVKGQPNFAERVANNQHTCQFCLKTKPAEEFMPSTSRFWALGHINVCYSCLEEHIDYKDLNVVNRLLQFADIAFEPNEWIKLYNRENEGVFRHYAQLRHHKNYLTMDWSDQNKALIEKAKHGVLDAEIDETKPALIAKLTRKWGDFEENDLLWLEDFYNEMASDYAVQSAADKGLLHTFAITSLQNNRLLKEGSFSKEIMTAYQNLLTSIKKTLEKDENDQITSIGELVGFLEEEGFQPKFYDGMTRDQADYIIEDTQRFLQNLIMNQVNIQDIVNNAAMQYAAEEGVEAMEEKLIDATRPPKERD